MKKEIELPKGATIDIRQDKVIIEYDDVFKPKNGDFCVIDEDFYNHRTLFIYNGKTTKNGTLPYHAARVGTITSTRSDGWFSGTLYGTPRPATEDERGELLAALHGMGKDWDAKKMRIVELKWEPKWGDLVYYASVEAGEEVHQIRYSGVVYHQRLLKRGLLFRTRAEAVACTERMLDAVKQK